jgi:hypothetical protein
LMLLSFSFSCNLSRSGSNLLCSHDYRCDHEGEELLGFQDNLWQTLAMCFIANQDFCHRASSQHSKTQHQSFPHIFMHHAKDWTFSLIPLMTKDSPRGSSSESFIEVFFTCFPQHS